MEKTLTDKLERMGYKVKTSKGFLIISNAVISSISSKPMEYAFKIDRKSKKEKNLLLQEPPVSSRIDGEESRGW